jgi:hypothetical protein
VTIRAALVAALAAALLATAAPPARADGDPASDVLLYQKVFVPYYGKTSKPADAELKRVVAAANKQGYPIRVALIGNRYDLGSVAVFWLKPKGYARFLGKELGLTGLYRGRLLVVMPNGWGVSKNGSSLPAELAGLAGVPTAKAKGEDVATAALRAVKRLAAKQGVQLAVTIPKAAPVASTSGSGSSNSDRIKLVAIAVVLLLLVAALETARRLRGRRREPV